MNDNNLNLSNQLDKQVQEFRNKNSGNCSPEILNAIQGLFQIPLHIKINIEKILEWTQKDNSKNRPTFSGLFNDDLFGSDKKKLEEFKNKIIHTVHKYQSQEFISAEPSLQNFLQEILEDIKKIVVNTQKTIKETEHESTIYRDKAVNTERKLKERNDEYGKLQKNYWILESNMCRDYQLILQKIGIEPINKTQQEIKHITEEALKEVGVEILWKPPQENNEKYFITQNDSEASVSGVIRPCLTKESQVIHKGVIINQINVNKGE